MNPGQIFRILSVTPPAAIVNTASFVTAEIDTRGFDELVVVAYLGAVDIGITVLKLQESDTTGSGFTDVPGLVFGTSLDVAGILSVLPSATDDNKMYALSVDLRGRKRFMDAVVTIGTGATGGFVTVFALGFRREETLQTAASRGFGNILQA